MKTKYPERQEFTVWPLEQVVGEPTSTKKTEKNHQTQWRRSFFLVSSNLHFKVNILSKTYADTSRSSQWTIFSCKWSFHPCLCNQSWDCSSPCEGRIRWCPYT